MALVVVVVVVEEVVVTFLSFHPRHRNSPPFAPPQPTLAQPSPPHLILEV